MDSYSIGPWTRWCLIRHEMLTLFISSPQTWESNERSVLVTWPPADQWWRERMADRCGLPSWRHLTSLRLTRISQLSAGRHVSPGCEGSHLPPLYYLYTSDGLTQLHGGLTAGTISLYLWWTKYIEFKKIANWNQYVANCLTLYNLNSW